MARQIEFDQAKMIDKARDLYWQKGYEATSIQDLITYLGISRSSLYNTFEDKHTLFIRALTQYQQAGIDDLQTAVAAFGYSRLTIERIINSTLDRALNDELCRGCFLANSMVEMAKEDQDVAQLANEYREEIEDIFYQSLIAAQEAGDISPVAQPRALARHLYSVLVGLNAISKSRPDPQVLKDIAAMALAMLD